VSGGPFKIVPLPKPTIDPEIARLLGSVSDDLLRITGIEQVISEANPDCTIYRVHAEIPRGIVVSPVKHIDFYAEPLAK
jgi:hypothetical protein